MAVATEAQQRLELQLPGIPPDAAKTRPTGCSVRGRLSAAWSEPAPHECQSTPRYLHGR